jgi:bifunctional UDP-N-acetylglucosamine pyrophosphorylase / glucosamine-1-phosphate N-acetyltransferase
LVPRGFLLVAKHAHESENEFAMVFSDTVFVILAAGKGTRMRSDLAKVLHRAGGRTLVENILRACQPLKPGQLLVVVGHQAEEVSAVARSFGAETVLQNPQRGTGHAMQIARRAIRRSKKLAVVLPGDAPLLRTKTIASLIDTHRRGEAAATVLSAELADPSDYGRIVRDTDGRVQAIVEEKSATPEQRSIREVNSGIYCFTLEKLWPCLSSLRPENAHHELYLTDAIGLLRQRNERILAEIAPDQKEVLGCNTRAHLAEADRIFRARKAVELMDSGVTIYMPETVVIDPEVTAGPDSLLEPGVQLLGKTRLGARCTVRTGSILKDTRTEDDVLILAHCVLDTAHLARKTQIGPFSRLRPGSDIREGAHVGGFVEIKKSVVDEGAKVPHLSYVGDATIGSGTNIGAGTITCNYDGFSKHPTRIGRGVFIGSNTALVAPVRVGAGAYIAAGSVITENVPADALAIARGRQANKPGWAKARRAEERSVAQRGRKAAKPKRRPRKSHR